MFNKSNQQSRKTKELIQSSLLYEQDKELMYKRSNRRAWTIAGLSIALLIGQSIFSNYQLNKIADNVTQPTILGFDRSTGIVDPISIISKNSIAELGANEALDKHFVNQYIQDRESYTYQTIQKTYDLTQLFSSEEVAKDYIKSFNLDALLGKGTATVKVVSITLEQIADENIATARIQVDYKNDKGIVTSKNFTVRLTYEFSPNTGLSIADRINNPMGFFVTSYQKVQENL